MPNPAWRYIGTVGSATAYECPKCMAIVHLDKVNKHDQWHQTLGTDSNILAARIGVVEKDMVQHKGIMNRFDSLLKNGFDLKFKRKP